MAREHKFVGKLNEELKVVGKDLPRIDGILKATGQAVFAGDVTLPGMLVGKVLRSPYPHAKILSVDTSKAEKLTGVKAVVTGKDHPGNGFGPVVFYKECLDNQVIQREKVRYIGDAVAAVAATDEDAAMEAISLIKVDYEILPAVFDAEEAYRLEAPQIHDHAERNVCFPVFLNHGDVEKGFKESDVIVELKVETGRKNHAQIEPYATVARYDPHSRKVTVWTTTQSCYKIRQYLSDFLEWPLSSINIVRTYCGGGFGGKGSMHPDLVGSILLSQKANRPVRIAYSREEHFLTSIQKHPMKISLRAGFKKNGKIMALDANVFSNTGAYAEHGLHILHACASFLCLTYILPNYRFDGKCMYTNTSVCGPHRGFGNQQGRFALEQLMDMAADQLQMDPSDLRLINAVYPGYISPSDWKITSCGLRECIEEVVKKSGYREKRGKMIAYHGIGLGCTGYVSGARVFYNHDSAGAFVKLTEDGTVSLMVGNAEIGQGSDTVISQVVAEELGVGMEDVIFRPGDTETTPMDLGAFASRTTLIVGNAARKAAKDAKQQLLNIVAEKLECDPEDLEMKNKKIYVKGSPDVPYLSMLIADAVTYAQHCKSQAILGRGFYDPPTVMPDFRTGKGNYAPAYSFGAAVAEVQVDADTGKVKVLRMTQSQDVGYPINPLHCEGQIEGSILGAMGQILYEDYRYNKEGLMVNPSLLEYRIPTAKEAPEIDSILVITNDPEGPFGAKGMSESPEIPVIGAISNAIYDAIGVRMRSMPITPEKILKALEEKKAAKAT
jgi:4-hydroxybenzoyl-CoA reductase subunit alpha